MGDVTGLKIDYLHIRSPKPTYTTLNPSKNQQTPVEIRWTHFSEDILSVDNSRRTPLHLAASMGSGLDQLLAHGAPVDAKDHLDRRPLHYAILLGCLAF